VQRAVGGGWRAVQAAQAVQEVQAAQGVQVCMACRGGAYAQTCRATEAQVHRGAEAQGCRGAEAQMRLESDDEVEDPAESSGEEEAGEDGGPDEAARLEAAATPWQVELLHVHGAGARGASGMVCRVQAVLWRSGGDVASMTCAEGHGRPARQRVERRHARAQARGEHARLAEHPWRPCVV